VFTIGQTVIVRENGKDPQVFTVTAVRDDRCWATLAPVAADREESETS
jgi:hypothetical protein